jgi:hypothetical protein
MDASNKAPSLVLALQLHGYRIAGRYAKETSDPTWLFAGSGGLELTLPGRVFESSSLGRGALSSVFETRDRLDGYSLLRPRSAKDMALHRFMSGLARTTDVDAVVDFTIALEALLLPGMSTGELNFRFKLHGAYYLAEEPSQRQGLAKRLRDIYDMRSRLVHGGKYPDADKIAAARNDACDLARRGLLRAVSEGFPDDVYFGQLLLGVDEGASTKR